VNRGFFSRIRSKSLILDFPLDFRSAELFLPAIYKVVYLLDILSSENHNDCSKVRRFRMVGAFMRWEYKIVALGLIVDATEPNQRERHEQILNHLGHEGWEAFAYSAQSDTVLLKRPAGHPDDEAKAASAADPTAETS
jgi:hypothetical protein